MEELSLATTETEVDVTSALIEESFVDTSTIVPEIDSTPKAPEARKRSRRRGRVIGQRALALTLVMSASTFGASKFSRGFSVESATAQPAPELIVYYDGGDDGGDGDPGDPEPTPTADPTPTVDPTPSPEATPTVEPTPDPTPVATPIAVPTVITSPTLYEIGNETGIPVVPPTGQISNVKPPTDSEAKAKKAAIDLDEQCGEEATARPIVATVTSNKKPHSNKISSLTYTVKLGNLSEKCLENGKVAVNIVAVAQGLGKLTLRYDKFTKKFIRVSRREYNEMTTSVKRNVDDSQREVNPADPEKLQTITVTRKLSKVPKGVITDKKGHLICAPGKGARSTKLRVGINYHSNDGDYEDYHSGRMIIGKLCV